MRSIAILDANAGISGKQPGIAWHWLKYTLEQKGVNLTEPESAELILITCVGVEQWRQVRKISRKYQRAKVIVGGPASTSPAVFRHYADAVCVGDGSHFIDVLINKGFDEACNLPNVLTSLKNVVYVDNNFIWDCPPIQAPDGGYRLWAGRGCKNKCYFCQTGWGMEYSENPNPQRLIGQAKRLKSKGCKISYVSNDPTQHQFHDRLPDAGFGSFSIRFLRKYGLPHAKYVRLGIEGVSERLRRFVNKPISHGDLVKCTSWLNQNGKAVRWFMIAGLPTEGEDDWRELRQAVQDWKRITPKGAMGIGFTAFCPCPATPLATAALDDGYYERFYDFWDWFFGGEGFTNRMYISKPQKPKARLRMAMDSMCLSEKELYEGGHWGENDIVEYPYKSKCRSIANKLF